MSTHKRQLRQKRTFRLELLESRELLSAVGLPRQSAAEIAPLAKSGHEVLKGTLTGKGVIRPITTFTGTSSFSSSGSVIGPSSFDGSVSYTANKKLAIKYSHGTGTLANSGGDAINVSFTGSGHETGVVFSYSQKGKVTGGAGIYAGAKGSFAAKGTLNGASGAFTITLTITLTHL